MTLAEILQKILLVSDQHPYRGNDDDHNLCEEQRASTMAAVAVLLREMLETDRVLYDTTGRNCGIAVDFEAVKALADALEAASVLFKGSGS